MLLQTIEHNDHAIEIYYDEWPESPRDWENLCDFVFFHKRYSLPNELGMDSERYDSWEEMERDIRKKNDVLFVLPVSMYDHGGVSLSIGGPSCPWDSGYIGFIVAQKQKVRNAYGIKRITQKHKQRALRQAESELRTFDQYVNGEVFDFIVRDGNGDIVDSCGGFFGCDHEASGLLDQAKSSIN